jgi:type III pantothenate kinase
MILCLDIGNTRIYGGLFRDQELQFTFSKTTPARISADEIGLFLKNVLEARGYTTEPIEQIAMCSVVPEATSGLCEACRIYFDIKPFVLQAGVKTGLKIAYRNPLEVGADRIANAIAVSQLFQGENVIVVNFGTATTFCAIGHDRTYLGGVIMPGLRIALEALVGNAAKLASVEIKAVDHIVGRSTAESMQAGLYFGQMGMAREVIERIKSEAFKNKNTLIIGTGEFAGLFKNEGLYDTIHPTLVLEGLKRTLELNT